MSVKKKAVFIDYFFHRKTQSSKLLKILLSKEYDLEELWLEDWNSNERAIVDYLNKNKFHTFFFFQCFFHLKYLKKINCERIIWFPMYDSEENVHYSSYIFYLDLNLKIFSFSKKLYYKFKKAGLECYYYKFYPKPPPRRKKPEKKSVFFWIRRPSDIDWNTAKKLLGKNKIEKTILQITPDPHQEIILPSQEDIDKYNIQIFRGWLAKKKFANLLSSCNIFIAPRNSEGIGMSFLEAFSQGMCVIAPNNSTMNEYITHGVNGCLYDFKNPQELDIKNFLEIGMRAREDAEKGYLLWKKKKFNILTDSEKSRRRINPIKKFCLKVIYYPQGVIFAKFLLGIKYLKRKKILFENF